MKDYYKVLGLPFGASDEDVHRYAVGFRGGTIKKSKRFLRISAKRTGFFALSPSAGDTTKNMPDSFIFSG